MSPTITINPIASKNVTTEIPSVLKVLGKGETKTKGQGMFRILNQEDGDKRIVWNSSSLTEINEAKNTFDKMVEQGLMPYEVDPSGKKTTIVMKEFNPHAEEIIFVPMKQLVGG